MPDWTRRQFMEAVGLSVLGGACAPPRALRGPLAASVPRCPPHDGTYDFIVVGSGAGGGPLACNLARACYSVLLLEAGGSGGGLNEQVPAFHAKASEDPAMLWQYFVKHYEDPERCARDTKHLPTHGGVFYPRAATLGGCTAHNALITVYPHASDFDRIAALTGDVSWRADKMRRHFERLEDCRYLAAGDPGHGTAGWLATELEDPALALSDPACLQLLLAAAETLAEDSHRSFLGRAGGTLAELREILRGDLNAAAPGRDGREGLFSVPLATKGGRRVGPRDYILATVAQGHPLTVQTHALVTRVLLEQKTGAAPRATGVEVVLGPHLYGADPAAARSAASAATPTRVQLTARREVILSAGAFNTPQLLKLSGIGPPDELAAHGIPVAVPLPGVGRNLQDRYEVAVVGAAPEPFEILERCSFRGDSDDACLADWRAGRGPYTTNGGLCGIVKRSRPGLADPDLFLLGLTADFRGYFPGYSDFVVADKRRFSWVVLKAHTGNTAGEVRLASADPFVPPEIHTHAFDEGSVDRGQDREDVAASVAGVGLARRIFAQANGMKVMPGRTHFEEIYPGSETGPDALASFVTRTAWGHHASCTCPIGADGDPMAVLDGDFRVRGVRGLRVVDASVFPRIPGFFVALPIYMISEKASEAILAAARESA